MAPILLKSVPEDLRVVQIEIMDPLVKHGTKYKLYLKKYL